MRIFACLLATLFFPGLAHHALAQHPFDSRDAAFGMVAPLCLSRPGDALLAQPMDANAAQLRRMDVAEALADYFNTLVPQPAESPLVRYVTVNGHQASARVDVRFSTHRSTEEVRLERQSDQWRVVRVRTIATDRP